MVEIQENVKKNVGKWVGLLVPFMVLIGIWFYAKTNEKKGYVRGKNLYEKNCSSCHGTEGEGLKLLIPPVNNVDFIQNNPENLACIIRYGISGEMTINGVSFTGNMLGLNKLEDDEVRDIVNFIQMEWNKGEEEYTLKEIRAQLDACL